MAPRGAAIIHILWDGVGVGVWVCIRGVGVGRCVYACMCGVLYANAGVGVGRCVWVCMCGVLCAGVGVGRSV